MITAQHRSTTHHRIAQRYTAQNWQMATYTIAHKIKLKVQFNCIFESKIADLKLNIQKKYLKQKITYRNTKNIDLDKFKLDIFRNPILLQIRNIQLRVIQSILQNTRMWDVAQWLDHGTMQLSLPVMRVQTLQVFREK